MKRNTLRWFRDIERMKSEEFVKTVHVRESVCPKSTGVREVLLEEEGWIKQGRSVWTGRGGGFSAVITPLGEVPGESEVSEIAID